MEEPTPEPIQMEQKSKEAEYLDQLQRLQADFINYRSRVEKEKLLTVDITKDNLLKKFLEVKDNFERIPKADKGVEMIYKQMQSIFDQEGVQEIIDMNYNPEMHEAIATAEGKENTIIEVTRKGYRRNGKVLRPVQVILGKKNETQTL